VVLGTGPVPLDVLETAVRNWIAATKSAPAAAATN
jgi:hypothetical protein